MTRYRTRPREVEAVQWFKHGDHPEVKHQFGWGEHGWVQCGKTLCLTIPTDWIVTDATGHRIVKAADFAEQFEEISDE